MNRYQNPIAQIIIALLIITAFMAETVSAQTITQSGDLNGRIIETADSSWTKEEVALVGEVLANTAKALSEAGLDSEELMSGYRFRRYHGQYVDGKEGRIALVRHHVKEIVLGDAAFLRLNGFYIYHEIGHVVDKQLDREPNRRFHELAGSAKAGEQQTAAGFWLNDHARDDHQEATADAFALWVMIYHTGYYRPVFVGTPVSTDYDRIVEIFDSTIKQGA